MDFILRVVMVTVVVSGCWTHPTSEIIVDEVAQVCRHNGTAYGKGELLPLHPEDPCFTCYCDGEPLGVQCSSVMCSRPSCANPISYPAMCCQFCPEEQCYYAGRIIPVGVEVTGPRGEYCTEICRCPDDGGPYSECDVICDFPSVDQMALT